MSNINLMELMDAHKQTSKDKREPAEHYEQYRHISQKCCTMAENMAQ
jgi:hypothetical protein